MPSAATVRSRTAAAVNAAFTLAEVALVSLIMGLLLLASLPKFVRARVSSPQESWTPNLKQIDPAAVAG